MKTLGKYRTSGRDDKSYSEIKPKQRMRSLNASNGKQLYKFISF